MLKLIRSDNESHYILVKRIIQQEKVILIYIHTLNIGDCIFIKQVLLDIKGQINTDTIIGNLSTPLLQRNRTAKQKLSIRDESHP